MILLIILIIILVNICKIWDLREFWSIVSNVLIGVALCTQTFNFACIK